MVEPRTRLIRYIDFAKDGNSRKFRREGWFENALGVWALASGSRLTIPIHPSTKSASYVVAVRFTPFLGNAELATRVIEIRLNADVAFRGSAASDIVVGASTGDDASDGLNVDFSFPRSFDFNSQGDDKETEIFGAHVRGVWVFSCTERLTESDRRCAPLPMEAISETEMAALRLTGLTSQQLLLRFESLGHSCDFGYAQRALGLEPLGLFRWGAISTACAFFGLINKFQGIGSPDSVRAYVPEGQDELWLLEAKYDIHFHTFVHPKSISPKTLIEREGKRLPFLRRKLLEDLHLPEKMFVLKRPHPICDAEAVAVWAALNLFAPHDLLYVSAHHMAEPGALDIVRPHLFRGYADRGPGVGPDLLSWISVCANAYAAGQLIDTKQ